MSDTLRIALPNKGRLADPVVDLLSAAGLSFERTERALSVHMWNADIELLFVRTDDIGELLTDGVADLGVSGQDLLADFDAGFETLVELGIGRCSLVAAVPRSSDIRTLDDFEGIRVATSHRRVTASYFADRNVKVDLVPLKGSVEVAPKLGIAEAIVDLVSSGSTLLVNSLRPVLTIMESQAVLVAPSPHAPYTARKAETVHQFATMIQAVVAGRTKRYLLMNAPEASKDEILALLPSLDSPTVIPLADGDHVAIHSVINRDEAWDLLPRLQRAGATGLLVVPIGQMVP